MSDDLLRQIINKLDGLDKDLTGFREETNKKLNTITKQVVRNSEQLTSLAKKVDKHSEQLTSLTKTQALLIAGQQKQDKILEALAMRSLEQETDIRDLKKIK